MPDMTITIPADLRSLTRAQLDDLRRRLGESKRLKRVAAIEAGDSLHRKPFVATVAAENAALTRIAWEEYDREESAFQRRLEKRTAKITV